MRKLSKISRIILLIVIILLTGGLFAFFLIYKRKQQTGYKNNPLGIEYRKENEWKGSIRPHNGNRFESFQSKLYGIRAGAIILKNYKKAGFKTINQIINRWAPPTENNTRDYIAFIEYLTNIEQSMPIDVDNDEHLYPLLKAMAKFESGYNLTESEFIKSQSL